MCSISGFLSQKPISGYIAERLGSSLIYYGSERGDQSCGAYVNGQLYKKACSSDEFIFHEDFEKLFSNSPKYGLFHTRFPTCGGLGDAQAQPFIHGDTISIHNGWFSNMHHLKRLWNLKKASGVDSELLAEFIHNYGIRKVPEFLKSSEGCSAFAILNRGNLYLMRHGNPIHYTFVDLNDGNMIFVFASTEDILNHAIRYCWLIPDWHPTDEVKEGFLFKVTPHNFERLSEFTRPRRGLWSDDWETELYAGTQSDWAKRYNRETNYPDMPFFTPSSKS